MREHHDLGDLDGRVVDDRTEILDPPILRFFPRAMTRARDGRYVVFCQGDPVLRLDLDRYRIARRPPPALDLS
jgi:hypothetical protein